MEKKILVLGATGMFGKPTASQLKADGFQARILVRDAEKALQAEPGNEYNQAKVRYLKMRLKDLEEQAPWLVSGLMIEYGLWGMPH